MGQQYLLILLSVMLHAAHAAGSAAAGPEGRYSDTTCGHISTWYYDGKHCMVSTLY